MFNLKNYEPKIYCAVEEMIMDKKIIDRLKAIEGRTINEIVTMWNINQNEWNNDAPIILCFESVNLEICNYKLNELAITFDEIDLLIELEKFDFEEYGIFEYEWRDYHPHLIAFRNSQIISLNIIEYLFETVLIDSKDEPEAIGSKASNWILHGIEFGTNNGYFSIYNGLDENRIHVGKLEENDIRKIMIF